MGLLDVRASALSHRLLLLRDTLSGLSAGARCRKDRRDRCREQVQQAQKCLEDVREVRRHSGTL